METLKNKFYESLIKMEALARELEFDNFANIFRRGYKILEIEKLSTEEQLIEAYKNTKVFGGMGSWNDSPPYYAASKGLEEKYNQLTEEFYNLQQKIYKTLIK